MVERFKRYFLKYNFSRIVQRIYLDLDRNKIKTIRLFLRIFKILSAIESSNYKLASRYSEDLISSGHSIGAYYKSTLLFLKGRDYDARREIEYFLDKKPLHANGTYLYVNILMHLNENEFAWGLLEKLLSHSKRKKTWQFLSGLVCKKEDFNRLEILLDTYHPSFYERPDYDLLIHYTNGAYRCGEQYKALDLWKLKYNDQLKQEKIIKNRKSNFSIEMASHALKDIKKCLDKAGIPFFLISGTLLGCIREGTLLSHDKDIDLGVWDSVNSYQLIAALRNSGYFYILPSSNKDLVVVRHVNGISIDLFIHYRTDSDYYHMGVKCIWHNTPFSLKGHYFLNDIYLIPVNTDLYLQENYGDWQTPKLDFDSALDTPNMTILDIAMMQIYLYKKLLLMSHQNSALKTRLELALEQSQKIINDESKLEM